MEVGSYPDARLSRRRRRFFQGVLVTRPKASTSDRDPPTACRWPSPGSPALSASGESGGVPGPGDAYPLSPCLWVSALSDHAAPGLRREAGGVWPCHSNHRRPKGRAPSHPVGERRESGPHGKVFNVCNMNKTHRKMFIRHNQSGLALLSCRSTAAP